MAGWCTGPRIGDPKVNAQHPLNKRLLDELAAANIPVRHKVQE